MSLIVDGFEDSVTNLLREIYNLGEGGSFKVNKLNWTFEMLETICEQDVFSFGLVVSSAENEWEIKAIQDKVVAKLVRALVKRNLKEPQTVGKDVKSKIADLHKKAEGMIEKYFSESLEETNKTDFFKCSSQMKASNVISKTYVSRRLSPYIYGNRKIAEAGFSPVEAIDLVFDSLVGQNLIVELTEEQCLEFETKAKLYGVFR